MRFGSLFAGIEGFGLGLERSGMTPVWQCELNPQCRSVLARHWPEVQRHDDVTTFHATIAVRPDVICGGFPCQDLSVAGKRAGLAGERSGLFYQFMRVVSECAPHWVVIENVPGLLSSNGTRDMGAVLWTLGQLGYGWAYRVLDAQWFGVAQRRRRVFIVGCLGDGRRAAQVLFESDCLPWDSAPSREARTRTADATAYRTSGNSGVTEQGDKTAALNCATDPTQNIVGCLTNHHGRNSGEDAFIAASLVAKDGRGVHSDMVNFVSHPLKAGGNLRHDESHDTYIAAYQCHGSNVGPMGTFRSGNGNETGGVPFVTAFAQNQRDELREMEIAGAIAAEPGMKQQTYARTSMGVRRLMPVECERLQGFPDDWTRYGSDGAELSDSARYRMLGNAVCVNVAEWIGRRIMQAQEKPSRQRGS